jgi:nucleotide-binding universal stress UspA family protein
MKIEHILCPVDFSDASAHAADLARMIAGWYGARLTALHVTAPMIAPIPGFPAAGFPASIGGDEADRRRLAEETAAVFHHNGPAAPAVDVVVTTGRAAEEILETARQLNADLIVAGTHGSSGFERLLLGSVAEKVLRKASCPVITVPPRAHASSQLPFKHIVCAVDFSPCSMVGFEHALSLAQEADASLTIVHVLEWPWPEPPAPAFEALPNEVAFSLAAYRKEREADARARLDRLLPADARNWCSPQTRLRHGKPYVELLKAAADVPADLIVVGVSGRSAFDRALFGSTTAHVVRAATCPVLTVRPRAEKAVGAPLAPA